MANVKKQYEAIFEVLQTALEAKPKCQLQSVMPALMEIMEAKNGGGKGTTFHKVDDQVVAIYCYYHKRWELVEHIPYGVKKSTATGLATMCKAGVSSWNKQLNDAKRRKNELLDKVASGDVAALDLPRELALIEEDRNHIIELPEDLAKYSSDDLEALLG